MINRQRFIPIAAAFVSLFIIAGIVAAFLLAGDDDGGASESAVAPGGEGFLGLTVTLISQELRVTGVDADGPAAGSGIEAGDVIRAVDGTIVRTPEQLRRAVEAREGGDEVVITYERGSSELQAHVTLGTLPAQAQVDATSTPTTGTPVPEEVVLAQPVRLGVGVEQITPALQQSLGLARAQGVVITSVEPESAAARAGLERGDIVLRFVTSPIGGVFELVAAVAAAPVNQPVAFTVLRGDAELTIWASLPLLALPGLENLPRQVREQVESQIAAGNLNPAQVEELLSFYRAQANSVRVGTVLAASAGSLRLAVAGSDAEATIALAPSTTILRGRDAIAATDLRPGELVFVVSRDGATAFSVTAYGVLPALP